MYLYFNLFISLIILSLIAIRFKNFKVTLNIKQVDSNYKITKNMSQPHSSLEIKKVKKCGLLIAMKHFSMLQHSLN